MKYLILAFLIFFLYNPAYSQNYIKNVEGDYLGMEIPGDTAEIFAPGIVSVSDRYEYGLAISPNQDQIFFTAESAGDQAQLTGLLLLNREGDRWFEPKKANLNQKGLWEQEAFFSPNGSSVFYAVVYNDSVKLWKSLKTDSGWSGGIELNSPINKSGKILFYSTLSNNQNMYYTDVMKRKILMSPFENGRYDRIIDPKIEKGGHGFISSDESFVLLDASGDDSNGKKDIYIAFRNEDGGWSKPVNLGQQVNTEFSETCPSLSPDGKYIFFGRYNDINEKSNIYWISSKILEELKP
ncbi:MAG: hypothetical protein KOO66_06715 [Bacteroidales bacterium]|nr:hypothetical protein [Bacteroidales bacterium]